MKTTYLTKMLFLVLLTTPCMMFAQQTDTHDRFEELMFGERQQLAVSVKGHSHNDYQQDIPFFTAYYAGMESIEVDLFLRNDSLYAAHEISGIKQGVTLEDIYLKPLASLFKKNDRRPFVDGTKSLQLLLDFKEDYKKLMPPLLTLLKKYQYMVNPQMSENAVKVVISGNMPPAEEFDRFPKWIYFDGRPQISYTDGQQKRLGVISDNLKNYTNWNGKGVPSPVAMAKIQEEALRAKAMGVPFRLWGTPESVNTWLTLEKMGVSWLNTDHPTALAEYIDNLAASRYTSKQPYKTYQPTYSSDGKDASAVRNVILLIGDGMGMGHVQAVISANRGQANMSKMKHIGFSFTSSFSPGNTDSGAGGSAIATGQKTLNEHLSVDTNGNPLPRIPSIIRPWGVHTGIVSTGDLSDATPAAFYTSNKDRNASEAISNSLIYNKDTDILVGGKPSAYNDSKKWNQFAAALRGNEFDLPVSKQEFLASKSERLIYFLPDSLTRPVKDGRGPILSEILVATIDKLKHRDQGFFIMAEGAQIDWGGHARDLEYTLTETQDFDQAVGEALRFADHDGNTLVIVVADHETGALSLLDTDWKSGFVHGNFASNDHSSMAVPVFTYGPGAQNFTGFFQNTYIFDRIVALFRK
ncbi:alkaline phosphatase [Sphingobacterium shayense]|uniref:alkaline phosphatase n=1 Tax=Sphingobacterium shayense TaxID=626343 RepID=UPI001554B456|nr:alkaline phosphatase [Sphingobacterium shayense]NQD72049.1 alkaline phosphatase [Sphingobacterium shayense]